MDLFARDLSRLEPFDQAAIKLLLTWPASWKDPKDDLSATELHVLNRLVDAGMADLQADVTLTWQTRLWFLQRRHKHTFLYVVTGEGPVQQIMQAGLKDANFPMKDGRLATGCNFIHASHVCQFRLNHEGELARHDIQTGTNVGFVLKWVRNCHGVRKLTRMAWEHHEKTVQAKSKSASSVAIVQQQSTNVNVHTPVIVQSTSPAVSVNAPVNVDLTALFEFVKQTIGSQTPAETPASDETKSSVAVDLSCRTICYSGKTHDVTSIQALRWVKVLAEHPGEYITASELQKYDNELLNVRTDKLLPYLPSEIQGLIESKPGAGSRLKIGRA